MYDLTEVTYICFENRELTIYTTDGFCDGKTSDIASSSQPLSGPLCVVELRGPIGRLINLMYAHINKIGIPTDLEPSVLQIDSLLMADFCHLSG